MSQVGSVTEKPKVCGRGRGMARRLSNEEGPLKPREEPPRSNAKRPSEESEPSANAKDGKPRRTKAGFQPYQVKKNLSVLQDEHAKNHATPERRRTLSRGSSSGDRKSKTDHGDSSKDNHRKHDGKTRRNNNNNSNSSAPQGQGHRKQQQQQHSWKKNDSTTPPKPNHTSNKEEAAKQSSIQSTKNDDSTSTNEKTNSTNAMCAEDQEKQKQRMLGHSLLQCPCAFSPTTDSCTTCSNETSKSKDVDGGSNSNETQSEDTLNAEKAVIDSKFLVASPVSSAKENSVLDSEYEEEVDNVGDDIVSALSPSQPMTHDEINALFSSKNAGEVTKVSITEKSLERDLTESGCGHNANVPDLGSTSHISISSSSGNSDSRMTSVESDFQQADLKPRRQCADTQQCTENKRPRQRNVLNSIVNILNENKSLDTNDRSKQTSKNNERDTVAAANEDDAGKLQQKRKERKNSRKRDANKDANKKRAEQRSDQNTDRQRPRHAQQQQQHTDANKRGGMISLPDADCITNNSSEEKNVHFNVEEQRRSSTSKSEKDESVKRHLKKIESFQQEMKSSFKRPFDDVKNTTKIVNLSESIQQQYGELIVYFQEYAFRHDFESAMWKSAFHNIITKFREYFETHESETKEKTQSIGSLYWTFLQNGIQYLDALTNQLQEKCEFDLEKYLEDPIRMQRCSKQVKFALRSCHLLLIYIGDLERYISQLKQEDNYCEAQRCYKQAQMLAPKNGKSYNQLAVVAVLTKRKLDAVYYYSRSLMASNPIQTAKDRLTAIFHEIKKKARHFKQSQPHESLAYPEAKIAENSNDLKRRHNHDHLRDEIWIFLRQGHMFKVMLTDQEEVVYLTPPPGELQAIQSLPKTSLTEKRHSKSSLREINRGFVIYYLYVHCKLYTNIGLEEFTVLHQETLSNFATLLEHPKASSLKTENVLKYMAINIFSIHHLVEKNASNDVIANTALDLALVFSMDMFAVLCKTCTKLLKNNGLSSVDQFLPSIRVWLLWMLDNAELVMKSSVNSILDIWSDVCTLFNVISSLYNEQQRPQDLENAVGEKNVYLVEDLFLSGFKQYQNQLKHCPADTEHEDSICRELRVHSVHDLIVKLDEAGKLPFACDEREKIYKAVQSTQVFLSPVKKVKHIDSSDDNQDDDDIEAESSDVIIDDSDDGDDDDDEVMDYGDASYLSALKAQKAELTRLLEESENKRRQALKVIETHKAEGRHISENSPSYLVTDTNCFIDHLQHVVQLLDSKDFNIIVPLIVINELDGLKKGSFTSDHVASHNKNVQLAARNAIDMLEDRFSRHDPNLRAITSSGSELSTIVFRAEELSNDRGTNDDVILSCCLKYCKEYISRSEGESKVVRRDVVLLTNDRNLRLKAHTRVVPTVPIATFMKMAQFL